MNGIAPVEVADDDEIRAKLREKNADYAQFNKERVEKRTAKLEEVGAVSSHVEQRRRIHKRL